MRYHSSQCSAPILSDMQRDEENDGKFPEDLDCSKVEQLSFWLSRFVVEERREDGKPYCTATINILAVRLLSVRKM